MKVLINTGPKQKLAYSLISTQFDFIPLEKEYDLVINHHLLNRYACGKTILENPVFKKKEMLSFLTSLKLPVIDHYTPEEARRLNCDVVIKSNAQDSAQCIHSSEIPLGYPHIIQKLACVRDGTLYKIETLGGFVVASWGRPRTSLKQLDIQNEIFAYRFEWKAPSEFIQQLSPLFEYMKKNLWGYNSIDIMLCKGEYKIIELNSYSVALNERQILPNWPQRMREVIKHYAKN